RGVSVRNAENSLPYSADIKIFRRVEAHWLWPAELALRHTRGGADAASPVRSTHAARPPKGPLANVHTRNPRRRSVARHRRSPLAHPALLDPEGNQDREARRSDHRDLSPEAGCSR